MCAMAEDHVDRFLKQLEVLPREVGLDLEVEGIVDRIGGINRRLKRGMERILAEHALTPPEFHTLGRLRLRPDLRSSPGVLAADLELSSGAMTTRLDALEKLGLIRRLPDPDDRRGVIVELTDAGRKKYDSAVSVGARREAFFASALTKAEQRQLNGLLRKLLLALEAAERDAS